MERDETERFDFFTVNTSDVITAQLIVLEEKGACILDYEGRKISSICFNDYLQEKLMEKYKESELSPEEPFPNEESCGFKFPRKIVETVRVKEDFMSLLKRSDLAEIPYIRLEFPQKIREVLLSGFILKNRLPLLCLERIGVYLSQKNNATYLARKLDMVLSQSEQSLSDILKQLKENPGGMVETLLKPSAKSFPFFAQMSNFIIRDLVNKSEKQSQDHTFCQASYIIGYLNMHHRDQINREHERENALNGLMGRLKKAPYAYTLQDILSFKGGETPLLDNKYSREDLTEFLEKKTTAGKDDFLPEVIRLRTILKKEYYIHRGVVIPLCYKGINDAHDRYRRRILDDWEEKMASFKTSRAMKDDDIFRRQLDQLLKKDEPLLYSMLSYELLFLSMKQNSRGPFVNEARGYLNMKTKALLPIDEILRLKRKDLYEEVIRGLPFWRAIPILSDVIITLKMLIKSLKGRKRKSPAKASREAKFEDYNERRGSRGRGNQRENYKARMEDLKSTFLRGDEILDVTLPELAEEWNPLYDFKAKANLVEDVNSLVRDYLRSLRRRFLISPPDEERIRNMACLLGENAELGQIKRRDALIRYLELYIIKCLM